MRFRKKLLLFLLALSLFAAVTLEVAGGAILKASLRSLAADRLLVESELLAEILEDEMGTAGWDAQKRVDSMGRALGVRVTLLDATGRVLADSEVSRERVPRMDNHLGRPEVQQALREGTGSSRRTSATLEIEFSYFARLLRAPEGPAGFVRLAVPTSTLEAGGASIRFAIAGIALVFFVALSALGYAATKKLSEPIERIAHGADLVASGRYETHIRFHGGGAEVEALGDSLDRMRRALLDQIRALEDERGLLSTVLSGMREGLLAVDGDSHVMLANAAFKKYFQIEEMDVEGRPLADVLRDPGAVEAFSRAIRNAEESRTPVEVHFPREREFEMLVAPLQGPVGTAGAIGIFLDVTRLHAVERMRRQFIADLSHEMRTPLSSLDAALENLAGVAAGDGESRDMFLGILSRNLERMKALIDDLTDLSLVESGAITLEIEPLNLLRVVREVEEALKGKAAEKQVTLVTEVPERIRLRADRRRLDQILMNIVDNAIKFNRPGGMVLLRAVESGGGVTISVEDTGRGVPPGDEERIFQRFYRTDRGRSRHEGGTGLGLAIVKHLMKLHGGAARAGRRDEGGTCVFLEFPAGGAPAA